MQLYQLEKCPYCIFVRDTIEELGLEVELRDIRENPAFREELREARGRTTVPVLKYQDENGQDQWLGESRDIDTFLRGRFPS